MKKAILTTVVGAVVLAMFAGNALAYEFIVESRPGGKNYNRYTDNLLDSSAKSTAPGCTSGIGSRYSGSTAATATFSFTAPESGNYEVSVTWGTSDKGDTSVPCRIYHDGGYTDKILNESQAANNQNKWNLQGTFYMVGGTIYTVVLTNPTLEGNVSPPRLMSDAVKWYIACGCGNVPAISTQVPHMPGDTIVKVTGIDATASLVTVYVNGVQKGTANPGGNSSIDVTLSTPLAANDLVVATQTMLACDPPVAVEGCKATTGPLAGTCGQIPAVTALPILIAGDTSVVVSGVDASATAVNVYAGGVGPAIGVLNNPVPAAPDNRVTVSLTRALANGEVISATQTMQSVGGSGLTQEGCIPGTGVTVGDCNQVSAVRATGMLDAGRTQIWVTDVTAGATAVKVYANDALIGTNNSPTSPMTAVTLDTALVEGQTVKATQVVRREGCLPSTGHRVMAAGIIDDFQDTIVTANTIPVLTPPAERTWYDAADNYYSEALQPTYPEGGSKWLMLGDHGWGNGIYAVYDAIIPPDVAPGSKYHLTMDMILDERGTVDTDYWGYNQAPFEMGVVVNGAHRAIGTPLPAISPAGKYPGKMTPAQDGCDLEPSVVGYSVTLTVNPGDSLLIAFASTCTTYSIPKTATPASYPGVLIDNIKLNVGPKPCLPQDVPPVGVAPSSDTILLEAGATEVKVTGLDPTASQVTVYEYTPNPDTWTPIGTATNLGGATSTLVTLTQPLTAHKVIVATQTATVCDPPEVKECEKPTIGPVVGTGKNSPVLLSLGIRETSNPEPCAIGTDGGTTGTAIEWIGPTGTVGGAPQGKLFEPSTEWQTVTFDPLSDPILSFNLGNGVLNGACGVLEHLAVAADSADPNTGSYTMLIDNVKSGEALVEGFEGRTAGDLVLFQAPSYSGTTSANLLTPPNVAQVIDTDGDSSTKCLQVKFQFTDEQSKRWVRLTTATATASVNLLPNPIVSLTQPITMRVKFVGMACNDPFADVDGDKDVDQADFAAFQACFTGTGGILVGGCECFDRLDDKDVDSDDAGFFEACASGAGIAADPNCD
ncbi:MAG: hypothetical protein QUV05_08260 [Phycisphaerae bacterium]|nr:hypothetical protein [Phycisphaerae bacterium]